MVDGLEALEIREVAYGSDAHRGELALRFAVLRAPLGMAEGSEVHAEEARCRHWVAVDAAGAVSGCVVFLPSAVDGSRGRLLQMAVAPELQGQGVGRLLVRALEAGVGADGVRHVSLHARAHAIGFYERLGYACEGEPYTEVGIPHRTMARSLEPPA